MKIGLDITTLYVAQAGVFYYGYNLIRAMLRLEPPEHEFLLLDYYPVHGGWRSPPEVDTLVAPHARTHRVKGLRHRKLSRLWFLQKPGLWPLAQGVDRVLLYPWRKLVETVMVRQLEKVLAGIDVFHSSDVLQFAVPGAKNVTTIHDLTTLLLPTLHTAETRELQQQKFGFAQEKADAVIAVSDSTRRDVISLLNIEPERVHVVYEGVDSMFRPLPAAVVKQQLGPLGLRPKEYILHVGTIEPRKNLVRLIEAYYQVRCGRPPPFPKLVLAGATGWFFHGVFERVRALNLSEEVVFLGRVNDDQLPALYNGAVLFAYPSLYEGFGLPVLEAMACGIPVITSNTSSLPEIVGEAGLMVDPIDTQALAEGLIDLLADHEQRVALASAGLQRAKLFSWEQAASDTLLVYR